MIDPDGAGTERVRAISLRLRVTFEAVRQTLLFGFADVLKSKNRRPLEGPDLPRRDTAARKRGWPKRGQNPFLPWLDQRWIER